MKTQNALEQWEGPMHCHHLKCHSPELQRYLDKLCAASTSKRIKICPFCVIVLVLALVLTSLVKTRL